MNWIVYSLIAIVVVGLSDIFRKLASQIKDPFAANFYFQIGTITAAVAFFLIFSRKYQVDTKLGIFAFIGGVLIATFTLISFKALSTGPGAATVLPVLRVGGIVMTVVLSVLFLKEKLSPQTLTGMVFSTIGIYLIFAQK